MSKNMSTLYTVLSLTSINLQNYNKPSFTHLMCEQKKDSKQSNLSIKKKIEEQ